MLLASIFILYNLFQTRNLQFLSQVFAKTLVFLSSYSLFLKSGEFSGRAL